MSDAKGMTLLDALRDVDPNKYLANVVAHCLAERWNMPAVEPSVVLDGVRESLARGAGVDAPMESGNTALFDLCAKPEYVDVVAFLIDSGAQVLRRQSWDFTPAAYAMLSSNPKAVELMAAQMVAHGDAAAEHLRFACDTQAEGVVENAFDAGFAAALGADVIAGICVDLAAGRKWRGLHDLLRLSAKDSVVISDWDRVSAFEEAIKSSDGGAVELCAYMLREFDDCATLVAQRGQELSLQAGTDEVRRMLSSGSVKLDLEDLFAGLKAGDRAQPGVFAGGL